MIKKTIYLGNPAHLSLKLNQLVVHLTGDVLTEPIRTIPIEDIGIVVLDNKQITLTQGLLAALNTENCALISCDSKHMPTGMFLPLDGNSVQNERFRVQLDASVPLRKQMWQQTIAQKIKNQAAVLEYSTGAVHKNMLIWAGNVRSGDPENLEARAAAYYWKNVFPEYSEFIRDREEEGPNVLLNYGYGVLRAVIARSLVSSGLLPTLGIHHHSRYNAYCLADDIMEPYRPFIDKMVVDIIQDNSGASLNQQTKAKLLSIPTIEVNILGKRSPLLIAASTTTASVYKCFSGEIRKIAFPEM